MNVTQAALIMLICMQYLKLAVKTLILIYFHLCFSEHYIDGYLYVLYINVVMLSFENLILRNREFLVVINKS